MLPALSQAWASWKAAPGVAVLAVVAFALGIGSATAIFTVINGVLLQPLPYPDGERFVSLYGVNTTNPDRTWTMSPPELQDYQQQTTSFDAFGWFRAGRFRMTAPGDPRFVPGAAVTPALARELGSPRLGGWFGNDTSAVISTSLWRRLGGGRDIIGRVITLDERQYTISGVMPPAFQFPLASFGGTSGETEVWIPLDPSPRDANRGNAAYSAYARRKPGVSLEQAHADVKRAAALVAATDPQRYQFYTADVADLRQATIGLRGSTVRAPLLILLGGAGLLLLIACANVATLLLARSVVRARETAIRVALGASRRQLALHYFAEGLLVSVVGAAAGIGLSVIILRQILEVASGFISRVADIGIDWNVLGFSVAIAVATGVLASLAPLWQSIRTAPNAVLAEGVRASAAAPAQRLSKAFVVVEIALAFALLTMSAILVVHMRNLERVPLGFDPEGLIAFNVTLPRGAGTPQERAAQRRSEQARLMEALRQTPGVTAAAFASALPAGLFCGDTPIYIEGRAREALAQRVCPVGATPDFFSTLRIPLRAGRLLNESDSQPRSAPAVVINEAAMRAYWSGRDPIGTSVRLSTPDNDPVEVVGVVGDVRNSGFYRPAAPEIYVPAAVLGVNAMNIVVRSDLPLDQVTAGVRRTIYQINPTVVMEDVRTIHDIVLNTLRLERLSSLVMTFFGLAALMLATLGIYGVVSYFVRQRTVELGTRMALGAVHRDLVALVLGGGLKLALVGVAVGSIALIGAVSLLVRYLAVANFGWLPFAGSTAVVTLVAAAAAGVPAWRTTLLSPMVAIREQQPSVWRWTREGMARAVDEIRQAVVGDDRGSDASPADMLAAFVDAARSADSYTGALRAALASVCTELRVESAALLERPAGPQGDYRCVAVSYTHLTLPTILRV